MGRKFSIYSLGEARAYLAHPILGARLKEATEAVLESETEDLEDLFGGSLDAQKFQSSMTLFAMAAQGPEKALFERVLAEYWDGAMDETTVNMMCLEPSQYEADQLDASSEEDAEAPQDELRMKHKPAPREATSESPERRQDETGQQETKSKYTEPPQPDLAESKTTHCDISRAWPTRSGQVEDQY